jgi:hypothetical protein
MWRGSSTRTWYITKGLWQDIILFIVTESSFFISFYRTFLFTAVITYHWTRITCKNLYFNPLQILLTFVCNCFSLNLRMIALMMGSKLCIYHLLNSYFQYAIKWGLSWVGKFKILNFGMYLPFITYKYVGKKISIMFFHYTSTFLGTHSHHKLEITCIFFLFWSFVN